MKSNTLAREVDIAINHDREALAMHMMNHPNTAHLCEDVWDVDPVAVCAGRKGLIVDNFAGGGGASTGIMQALMDTVMDPDLLKHTVAIAWFSPDCKHFSKAKGGRPVEKKIRGLALVAVKWAKAVKPAIICLENVEEFKDWGPLTPDGMPDKLKKGLDYRRFVRSLEKEGYVVETAELRACDYGTPTTRKRLFLVARCDGKKIVWPKPTHNKTGTHGLLPYLTAADCIDWSIPCPSIFTRARPLADNTLRRIARGIQKFVIDNPSPFIVGVAHGEHKLRPGSRSHGIDEPIRTVSAGGGDHAVVVPVVTRIGQTGHGDSGKNRSADEALSTVTSKAEHLLVMPYMVPRYGEREGQAPRTISVEGPMPTIVPTQNGASLVAAFLAKHNLGVVGQPLSDPVHTITAIDQKAVVTSHIMKMKGTCKDGERTDEPLHTVQAGGNHYAEVRAFLIKFYSEGGQWAAIDDPVHTIPTVDRMGLVTIYGEQYQIVDIGMRMLTARELANAQGFPSTYVLDPVVDGRRLPARSQVRMIGNSVCPPLARALVSSNIERQRVRKAA